MTIDSHGQSCTNLSMDLDDIQYIATTCWFVEAHANFPSFCAQLIFKRENSADVIL